MASPAPKLWSEMVSPIPKLWTKITSDAILNRRNKMASPSSIIEVGDAILLHSFGMGDAISFHSFGMGDALLFQVITSNFWFSGFFSKSIDLSEKWLVDS